MLREHGLELGEAARIFVLELHPGRTESVFLSERFHARGAQTRGYDFGLSAEALAFLRGRAIAAAADAQRKRAVRVAKAKMQCRKSSHRKADDVGFRQAEMIEHRGDVVRSARLGVRACGVGDVRGRIAPRVKGDAAVTLSEVAQLRLPAAMIPGELVHKNNCGTGAGLLVMQPHAVVGGGKGHLVILSGSGRSCTRRCRQRSLPGGIDSHVHLAQPSGPGIVMADDFESGTRSAALGGNTTVLPFCLQEKGQSLRAAVTAYRAKAEGQCHVDVSFHLIIADPTEQVLGQELPALIEDGYTSFKVFMTYEGLALSDREMLEVMAVARETGAIVMVHAENYDAIRFLTDRLERLGQTEPHFHAPSRPIVVEREATHACDRAHSAQPAR